MWFTGRSGQHGLSRRVLQTVWCALATAASKHRFALQIWGDIRRLIACVYFIALLDQILLRMFTLLGIALFELLPIKGQVLSDFQLGFGIIVISW